NFVLNWTFVRVLGFGHVGLALSTSVVALANCGLLYVILRRRVGSLGAGAGMGFVRIAAATAIMIAAAAAVDAAVSPMLPGAATARHALRLLVAIPVSAAVLWGAARVLGAPVPRLRGR